MDVDDLGGSTGFGALTTESVILASVLAAVVSGALLGEQPAFIVPAFELKNLAELPLYLPLGLLCGATAVAFRSSSAVIGRGFAALERGGASGAGGEERGETANSSARFALRVPREWHAPLGGAAFGVVATLFPEVTYQGFDNVNSMLGAEGSPFRTPYSPSLLTGLVLVKLAATALCRRRRAGRVQPCSGKHRPAVQRLAATQLWRPGRSRRCVDERAVQSSLLAFALRLLMCCHNVLLPARRRLSHCLRHAHGLSAARRRSMQLWKTAR